MAIANPAHAALSDEYGEWIDAAIAFAVSAGDPGLVLLVGSRGAGYADSWSDLDLWVIGDRLATPTADASTTPKGSSSEIAATTEPIDVLRLAGRARPP